MSPRAPQVSPRINKCQTEKKVIEIRTFPQHRRHLRACPPIQEMRERGQANQKFGAWRNPAPVLGETMPPIGEILWVKDSSRNQKDKRASCRQAFPLDQRSQQLREERRQRVLLKTHPGYRWRFLWK